MMHADGVRAGSRPQPAFTFLEARSGAAWTGGPAGVASVSPLSPAPSRVAATRWIASGGELATILGWVCSPIL